MDIIGFVRLTASYYLIRIKYNTDFPEKNFIQKSNRGVVYKTFQLHGT